MWPEPAARANHLHLQAIDSLPETLAGFEAFYHKRREILLARYVTFLVNLLRHNFFFR